MKFRLIIDDTKEETVVATVHQRSTLTDQIEELVRQHSGRHQIAAFGDDEMVLLSFDKIECITVENGKTIAIDHAGKRYRLKQRLYELEELLDPHKFVRISHSEIVNLSHITALDLSLSGTIRMTLTGEVSCFVSRRSLKKIKQALNL